MNDATPPRLDDVAVQGARDELARLKEADLGEMDRAGMARIVGRLEATVRQLLDVVDGQDGQ